MKKFILILLVVSFSLALFAMNEINSSIAETDNFLAPAVNPAAMTFRNSDGLGYLHQINDENYSNNYYLFFNFENFAYVFNHTESTEFHRFAFSTPLVRNLYLGSSLDWKNGKIRNSDYNMSLLYRPVDFLSIAAKTTAMDEDYQTYTYGTAVKPFAILGSNSPMSNRLTLSYEQKYYDEELLKPTIGIGTEIFNGLEIDGNYSLETETFGFNFNLNMGMLKTGQTAALNEDNEFDSGYTYLNISNKKFRSFVDRIKKKTFYEMPFNKTIVETKKEYKIKFISFSFDNATSIDKVKKKIERLKNDKINQGILLKSGSLKASYANLLELKKIFNDYKKSGKRIVYYADYINNINYAFAASIADEIYLNPAGGIDLRGFSVNVPYFKGLLDTLGIDVYNFRSHKYKTAGNSFSETEMTDGERETLNALLDDFYDKYLNMIEEGRAHKLTENLEVIIDNGPYADAKKTMRLGLVDGIAYEDEVETMIKKNSSKVVKNLTPTEFDYDWSKERKINIALINAVGGIHMGEGQEGGSIGSKSLAKKIRSARKNKNIQGIILRVNSGGGSALASDIIAREVKLCKNGKNKKPVVVVMTGAAASGGYYISAHADKIIAQPTTITGSIGVIGIIPNFKGLYDKIGINHSSLKRGEHADLYNTSREMTEGEKDLIRKSIKTTYDRFIETVAEGRNLSKDAVHEIAKGRVWTGKAAKEIGLVDYLGGMDKAVTEMKKLIGTEYELNLLNYKNRNDNQIHLTVNNTGITSFFTIPEKYKAFYNTVEKYSKFSDEKVLYFTPLEALQNVK